MQISLVSRDVKHLSEVGKAPTVRVTPLSEYMAINGIKKPKPDFAYFINVEAMDLGYAPVDTIEDATKRTVKRLGQQKRFWNRANLTEAILNKLKDGATKEQVSRVLTSLCKDEQLLVANV